MTIYNKMSKSLRKIIREEIQNLYEFQASDIEHVMKNVSYEYFSKLLGDSFNDPKVKAALEGGMNDGNETDDKISAQDLYINCSNLIPTQNEIDIDESLRFVLTNPFRMKQLMEGEIIEIKGPIVTLKEKYIIDGHHRWAQAYCINPNISIKAKNLVGIKNPELALKAVQTAVVSANDGTVPKDSVKGKNIFTCSEGEFKSYVINKVTKEVLEVFSFYIKNKEEESLRKELSDLTWKNVLIMRKNNQPMPNATSRDVMPQTDKVPGGVDTVIDKLESGEINIREPFFKKN